MMGKNFSILVLLGAYLVGGFFHLWGASSNSAEGTPVVVPRDPAKAKKAIEFFELGNAYAAKNFLQKANEYWNIARGLDPLVGRDGVNSNKAPMQSAFIPPPFKPDENRPYDNMARGLYEQAVENYSRGDETDAITNLKEAERIDPLQPQVQDFLESLQGPTEESADLLAKIKETVKEGKHEPDLGDPENYLDQNLDEKEAFGLRDGVKNRIHRSKASKAVSKAKKILSAKTPASSNDQDQQAKADQAYNFGLDSYRQGDYAAAKKFWEETLEIQPTHLQARRNLDRLLEEHPELK